MNFFLQKKNKKTILFMNMMMGEEKNNIRVAKVYEEVVACVVDDARVDYLFSFFFSQIQCTQHLTHLI